MTDPPGTRARRGAALVLLAAVLWGTLGVAFSLQGNMGTPPLVIAFWRATLACLSLAAVLALSRPRSLHLHPRDLPFLSVCGLLSVSALFALYPFAVQHSTVAVAAVLLYTAPAWVVVMGALWLGEPLTSRRLLTVVLCFAGTALVAGVHQPEAWRGSLPGLLAGLGSGLSYASYSLFARKAPTCYAPATMTVWTLGLGAVFLAIPAVMDLRALLEPWRSLEGVALLVYVGVFPTAGSLLLYTMGLRDLGDAGRASLLATLEPLVGAALGFALLGQALAPAQVAGGALVLAGVLTLQVQTPRPR